MVHQFQVCNTVIDLPYTLRPAGHKHSHDLAPHNLVTTPDTTGCILCVVWWWPWRRVTFSALQ